MKQFCKSIFAWAAILFSLGVLVYYAIPRHESFYEGYWTVITQDGKTYHHVKIRTAKIPGIELQTLMGKTIYIQEYFKLERSD